MAAAFHNNPNINFMTDNVALTCILIIRIIYLIVFVIGSVVSFVFLLVAYSDRTYGLALPVSYNLILLISLLNSLNSLKSHLFFQHSFSKQKNLNKLFSLSFFFKWVLSRAEQLFLLLR
jgi:hypothetical protein